MSGNMVASIQVQGVEHLAEMIAEHGLDQCIHLAARWHSINSTPNPPTSEELLRRVQYVKPEHINNYHQDLPNALALRLLAPRPGQNPGFEDKSTTKADGKRKYMYKCLGHACTFLGKDKDRHMEGQHVRDIDGALCCPYNKCKQIFYKTRVSEFKVHCNGHEAENVKLQAQRKEIIPLSSFQ